MRNSYRAALSSDLCDSGVMECDGRHIMCTVTCIRVNNNNNNNNNNNKYVSKIPGKHEAKELQKTATLGTAHILRKVLM